MVETHAGLEYINQGEKPVFNGINYGFLEVLDISGKTSDDECGA